ncbi:hypothetical protein OQA88_9313 [Cercophora sp. LCS_1]
MACLDCSETDICLECYEEFRDDSGRVRKPRELEQLERLNGRVMLMAKALWPLTQHAAETIGKRVRLDGYFGQWVVDTVLEYGLLAGDDVVARVLKEESVWVAFVHILLSPGGADFDRLSGVEWMEKGNYARMHDNPVPTLKAEVSGRADARPAFTEDNPDHDSDDKDSESDTYSFWDDIIGQRSGHSASSTVDCFEDAEQEESPFTPPPGPAYNRHGEFDGPGLLQALDAWENPFPAILPRRTGILGADPDESDVELTWKLAKANMAGRGSVERIVGWFKHTGAEIVQREGEQDHLSLWLAYWARTSLHSSAGK